MKKIINQKKGTKRRNVYVNINFKFDYHISELVIVV